MKGKLSYNYQLTLGSVSSLSFGSSFGILLNRRSYEPELTNRTINKRNESVLEIGMRYAYKSLYIGGSFAQTFAKRHNFFYEDNYFSLITGVNIVVSKDFILAPSFILKTGMADDLIKVQNNFVFLKNYNVGAGYNYNYFRKGYHLFAGVQVKQKLGINVAYEKYSHRSYGESQNNWLNRGGLELNLNYKFN